MNNQKATIALACAILLIAHSAIAVTISTVPVGNANNIPDTMVRIDGTTGYGSVPYNYRIGATEVTNSQYAEFLNAKAKSDPLELYNSSMGSNPRGGITRSGAIGSYTYSTKNNMGNKPVNFVSWYDSVRFINWLNNGQGDGDTETGAYTMGRLRDDGVPLAGNNIPRNAAATWFMTSENEWYKAAYFQPAAQGGDTDSYWSYPVKGNFPPVMAKANNVGDLISDSNNHYANYYNGADWNGQDGNVTTVGSAGQYSQSFYGTSDQAGNVREWSDTFRSTQSRLVLGGSYLLNADDISSAGRFVAFQETNSSSIGFRVVMLTPVPEPSTLALAALGALGLLLAARRRR